MLRKPGFRERLIFRMTTDPASEIVYGPPAPRLHTGCGGASGGHIQPKSAWDFGEHDAFVLGFGCRFRDRGWATLIR